MRPGSQFMIICTPPLAHVSLGSMIRVSMAS